MPQAKLSLALPEGSRVVEMVYLHRYGSHGDYAPVEYLHWVRVGGSQPLQEELYFRGLSRYTEALARLVEAKRAEVVLSPWSTRPQDARPYRERIGLAVHASGDWTHRFRGWVRSGLVKDCDKVYDGTRFEPPPHIGDVSSVLMVDDAVSGGNTACAVLRHLLNAGFQGTRSSESSHHFSPCRLELGYLVSLCFWKRYSSFYFRDPDERCFRP